MSLRVTNQDRKRVKNTAVVFSIIFIVCALIASIFAILTPRTKTIGKIGTSQELLQSIVGAHDGKTYFLQSKNFICEYDSFTNEQIQELNLTKAIKDKLDQDNVSANLIKNSLNEWRIVSALSGESDDYFLVIDNVGNLFKLKRNESGKLLVEDDYRLITGTSKAFKGVENIGNRLFSLVTMTSSKGSYFYVEEYDLENLAGPVKSKFLWDKAIGRKENAEGEIFEKIEAVKASTGVLAFYAHKDSLVFIKDNGGVLLMSTDLKDTNYGDGDVDFFADAAKPIDRSEEQIAIEEQAYEDGYKGHLINRLSYWCVEYVVKYGKEFKINGVAVDPSQIVDKSGNPVTKEDIKDKAKRAEVEEKTQDLFKSYSKDQLLAIVEESIPSATEKNTIKNGAVAAAEEAKKAVSLSGPEWLLDYDESTMSMYVKPEYFDESCYASYITGEASIFGMILSKKNDALYYTNASDGYLYTISMTELKSRKMGESIAPEVKEGEKPKGRIDTVHCEKGQSFDNFGNALGYNKFANTLYLTFANERKISIVDINDTNDYKVVSTFTANFNMYNILGDENNEVTHVFRKVTEVDNKGKDHIYYYYSPYESEKFENKGTITTIFVIFLAIAVVTFFIGLWLWLNSRNDKGVQKVIFIAKDSKKNKLVYLALVPFIAMLILFCYYEAVGAIAMSFFNYTKEEPAWIWNNFANYIKIFNDKDFLPSILNMLIFLLFDVVLSLVPPIIFAILLILIRNKTTSSVIRSLMFIPGIIPSIAGMLIWRVGIYGNEGLLNQLLGTTIEWLFEPQFAIWSLIFMGFPFVGGYLIFYGGMMNIPSEYHEAGKLEGLGTIKRFLTIDIPLIMPQIKYIFITTFIASVQNFARTQVLAANVSTPVQSMYTMMKEQGDYGMSSAYATLIFIFLFAAIATNFKMQKQEAMGADL